VVEAADVEDAPMNPQGEVAAVVHPVLEGHALAVGGGKEQEDSNLISSPILQIFPRLQWKFVINP
jgi:hypothetical protein